ncbi:MAG: glycosyltransferase family 4 protein [Candidatus Thorarchaeota archaeon]
MNGCRLHVANVIHYLHQGGGVAIQALNIAQHIESLGVSTSFITMASKSPDFTTTQLIERYPGRINTSQKPRLPLDPIALSRNLEASLQKDHCNVIQAYDPLVAGSASFLVKQAQKEIPLIIRLGTTYLTHFTFQFSLSKQGSIKELFENAIKQNLLLPILRIIERTTLRTADVVVANCDYLKGVYESLYPDLKNIVVIRNGVDTTVFTPDGPSEDLNKDKLTLLYVGRLEERKGLDDLFLAMAKVFKKHQDSCLILVGRAPDPRYKSRLEKLATSLAISTKIKFLGPVDNQSIPRLMRSADILVFPSSTHGEEIEGLPNTVLEGLATGIPIVATRICGIPEVVKHERTGLLVTPGSIEELTLSLDGLLDSKTKREELGSAARSQISEKNSLRSASRKYLNLYQLLADRNY